jgi:magnesium-transporting ATPase (P-type)
LKDIAQANEHHRKSAVLIDGICLSKIFGDPEILNVCVEVFKDCETVICCRVTPKQKAEVVRLMKERLN